MKLSVITVNYNAANSTIKLVQSIYRALTKVEFEWEVIVVDNCSEIEDVAVLEGIKGIVLIKNRENSGFAGGNNKGVLHSKGEYVMWLNNDTQVKDDIFTPLIGFFTENSKIGAVSPKLVYEEAPNLIQYAGYDECDKYLYGIHSSYIGMSETNVKDVAVRTPFMHGAAVMFRRATIDLVGLMREDYFLYFEELDYSIKIREGGYEVWYYPFARVFHNASHTTSRNKYAIIYYNSRNRLYLAANNLKGKEKIIAIILQLFLSLPKSVFKAVMDGDFNRVKAYIHGVFDFCRCIRGKLPNSV